MWDAPDINEPFSGSRYNILQYSRANPGDGWSIIGIRMLCVPFNNIMDNSTYEDPE